MTLGLPPGTEPFVDAALAVGIGLMIGLEREHHELVGKPERNAAAPPVEALLGTRTFALLALAGWAAGFLSASAGLPWLPAALLVGVAGFVSVPLLRGPDSAARGLTTEAAAIVTVLVGLIVPVNRGLAAAAGVATAVLLISKPWFQRVLPKLRRADLTNTVQVIVALAIVLPLLPVEAKDPWGVLSPRRIGLFVTLILSVSWIGYVLSRLLGARKSAGLVGAVGGLVSSTALTVAMAQRAARAPSLQVPGQLATFLACGIMSVRLLVVSAVISPVVALAAAPAVGAIGLGMFGGALWKWRQGRAQDGERTRALAVEPEVELANPMSLVQAVKWGAFMTVVLLAAALGEQYFGESGVLASAAVSGLADVDAITLAVTRSAADGTLATSVAVLAVVIAACVNTAVKAGIALSSGGRAYGRDVMIVFAGALVAGLAVATLQLG